jgi:hypothetical protein
MLLHQLYYFKVVFIFKNIEMYMRGLASHLNEHASIEEGRAREKSALAVLLLSKFSHSRFCYVVLNSRLFNFQLFNALNRPFLLSYH